MKKIYVTAYELAQITARPLPEILKELRNGKLTYEWIAGTRQIPLSQLYTTNIK